MLFDRNFIWITSNYLMLFSSDTVNLYRPLALLFAKTLLPFLVAILDLKPCLLTLFLFEG